MRVTAGDNDSERDKAREDIRLVAQGFLQFHMSDFLGGTPHDPYSGNPDDACDACHAAVRILRGTVAQWIEQGASNPMVAGSIPAGPTIPDSRAFDLVEHLYRQREWSSRTFGHGPRTKGVIGHIRKELEEIERAPYDLTEWIDVVILALDGAWRSGASLADIVAALQAKQATNEARQWPKPTSEDVTVEHVREAADSRAEFEEWARGYGSTLTPFADGHDNHERCVAWAAWQAARGAR